MAPASVISFPEVRHLQLIEHAFMSQIDILVMLNSCSRAQIREESSATARKYPARPCKPYEEADLRWGSGSLCDSAQLHACASAPACAAAPIVCCFARVAGGYAHCSWAEDTILAATDIYVSNCATLQADLWVAELVVRRGYDDCDGDVLRPMAS